MVSKLLIIDGDVTAPVVGAMVDAVLDTVPFATLGSAAVT